MGCCLVGCFRLLFFWLWRALLAALIALVLARIDSYVEGASWGESAAGKAWRAYRGRGKKTVHRGTPPDASSAIDTRGRPRP
jgi:hypothetical protein